MNRLFIYNPETEYALASGSPGYTPPASVIAIRRRGALILGVTSGTAGDAILAIDGKDAVIAERPDLACQAKEKGIDILEPGDLCDWSRYTADPWGWNPQIHHYLEHACPGLHGILSEHEVENIRKLAHRRTARSFLSEMPSALRNGIYLPAEAFTADEAFEHLKDNSDCFLKAPWSSSGRGVLRTSGIDDFKVRQWVTGIIRSQGSVIIEPAYNKIIDFATEWMIDADDVNMIGLSLFRTTDRGRYLQNVTDNQEEIRRIILENTSMFTRQLIDAMADALNRIIKPAYIGPLGIDMMALEGGRIHPCVEINLRHTMGSILI